MKIKLSLQSGKSYTLEVLPQTFISAMMDVARIVANLGEADEVLLSYDGSVLTSDDDSLDLDKAIKDWKLGQEYSLHVSWPTDVVRSTIPKVLPDEQSSTSDVEDCIQRLSANDKKLHEVNINNTNAAFNASKVYDVEKEKRQALIYAFRNPTAAKSDRVVASAAQDYYRKKLYAAGKKEMPEDARNPRQSLYMKVALFNRLPLDALIDPGAEMSAISLQVAKKCDISNIINREAATVVTGVGNAQMITYEFPVLPVTISGQEFCLPVTVFMNDDPPEHYIFGSDSWHRFQCHYVYDAAGNPRKLRFLTANGVHEVPVYSLKNNR